MSNQVKSAPLAESQAPTILSAEMLAVEHLDQQKEDEVIVLADRMSQWLNDDNTENNSPAVDCPELWEAAKSLIQSFAGIRSEDRRIRMELVLLRVRNEWVDGEVYMLENHGGAYATDDINDDEDTLTMAEKCKVAREKRNELMALKVGLENELKLLHDPVKLEMGQAELINMVAKLEREVRGLRRERDEDIKHTAKLNAENSLLQAQYNELTKRARLLEMKIEDATIVLRRKTGAGGSGGGGSAVGQNGVPMESAQAVLEKKIASALALLNYPQRA